MIITVFRSRLLKEHQAEYEVRAREMDGLTHSMPGFISIKTFVAEDGERCSIVEFRDYESLRAWAHHPRHLEAQALGRERFYLEFSVQSGEVKRERCFAAPAP